MVDSHFSFSSSRPRDVTDKAQMNSYLSVQISRDYRIRRRE
jgi:hypothetical protein